MGLACNRQHTTLVVVVVISWTTAMAAKSSEHEELDLINVPPLDVKSRVRIINELGTGDWVNVHCHSKDDDLGLHSLAPKQFTEFFFRSNYWKTTLFYCHVTWAGGNSHRFDAYIDNRDKKRCGFDCCWNLKPTGPCDCSGSGFCLPWLSPSILDV